MKIEIKKFGEILISRPAGRDAFLIIKSYLRPKTKDEPIELDFTGIKVMAPSWLDEVLSGIKEELGNEIVLLPTQNASVIESLKAIQ